MNKKEQNASPELLEKEKVKSSKLSMDLNILLIDCSSLIRTVVKDELAKIGVNKIYEAKNYQEAINIVKSIKPCVICVSYLIYELENKNFFQEVHSINPKTKFMIVSSTPKKNINPELISKFYIDVIPKKLGYKKLVNILKDIKSS